MWLLFLHIHQGDYVSCMRLITCGTHPNNRPNFHNSLSIRQFHLDAFVHWPTFDGNRSFQIIIIMTIWFPLSAPKVWKQFFGRRHSWTGRQVEMECWLAEASWVNNNHNSGELVLQLKIGTRMPVAECRAQVATMRLLSAKKRERRNQNEFDECEDSHCTISGRQRNTS